VSFLILALILTGAALTVLLMARRLYKNPRIDFKEIAENHDLTMKVNRFGIPSLEGNWQGYHLQIFLFSSRRGTFPDSLQISFDKRIHRHFGLNITEDFLDSICLMLQEKTNQEREAAAMDKATYVPLLPEDSL
jgi:hypothetical protein